MGLVNHTLESLNQGVSQQYDEIRPESYVEEMVNCIPDISRGVLRRNPTESFVSGLEGNKLLPFSYEGEDYLLHIPTTYVSSPKGTVIDSEGNVSTFNISVQFPDMFTYLRGYGGDVGIVAKDSKVYLYNKGYTGGTNVTSSRSLSYNELLVVHTEPLLHTTEIITYNSEECYRVYGDAIRVGNTSFTPQVISKVSDGEILLNTSSIETITSLIATYIDDYYGGTSCTYVGNTIRSNTKGSITDIVETNSYYTIVDGYIYNEDNLPNPTEAVWNDTTMASYLDNVTVMVTSDKVNGYYMKPLSNQTWTETYIGNKQYFLQSSNPSMPLLLSRSGSTWSLSTEDWTAQTVGTYLSIMNDFSIKEMFFHKDRLCLITGNNTLMCSETGNYTNFFPTTMKTLIDSDPIILTIGTHNNTTLVGQALINKELILFGDKEQYIIEGELFSPNYVTVSSISQFNIKPSVKPISVGDEIFFVSSSGEYERMYKYYFSNSVDNKLLHEEVTLHVPSYIPNDTKELLYDSTLGYVICLGNTNVLYVHNNKMHGEQQAQSALHKWTFIQAIQDATVLNNVLYILFEDNTVVKVPLASPSSIEDIVYLDNGTEEYTSYIELSEWQIKQEGKGNSRDRLQIKTIDITYEGNHIIELINTVIPTVTTPSPISSGVWDDSIIWEDNIVWLDSGTYYTREFIDKSRVTIMGNNKTTRIRIKENNDNGFILNTINFEGLYHQRSSRY